MRDRERRLLLWLLAGLETPERVSALVRNLATVQRRSGPVELRPLHARLRHVHLPLLESWGLVRRSADGTMVELTATGRQLAWQLRQGG